MRIRSIKPEFWTDKKISSMTYFNRLLFISLWNLADDDGRFKSDPRIIKGALYPLDETTTPESIEVGLRELSGSGRVVLYEIDEEKYGQVCNFSEHQVINKPSKSKIPKLREYSGSPTVALPDGSGSGREGNTTTTPPSARENWVSRGQPVWAKHLGHVSFGEFGKILKPMFDDLGEEKFLKTLEAYCIKRNGKSSIRHLAATYKTVIAKIHEGVQL
jgi:hypothetical protein